MRAFTVRLVNHWRAAKPIRLVLFDNHNDLRKCLFNMENRLMDKIDEVAGKFDELAQLWDAAMAEIKSHVAAEIDAAKAQAVADDNAAEAVRLDALAAKMQARIDSLKKPFEASNN